MVFDAVITFEISAKALADSSAHLFLKGATWSASYVSLYSLKRSLEREEEEDKEEEEEEEEEREEEANITPRSAIKYGATTFTLHHLIEDEDAWRIARPRPYDVQMQRIYTSRTHFFCDFDGLAHCAETSPAARSCCCMLGLHYTLWIVAWGSCFLFLSPIAQSVRAPVFDTSASDFESGNLSSILSRRIIFLCGRRWRPRCARENRWRTARRTVLCHSHDVPHT
jgi:hypothetical protein